MEVKKVTYMGVDIDDVTKQLEDGIAKMNEKGWTARREDMLSGTAVRVTYTRGPVDDDEDEEALLDALASMED